MSNCVETFLRIIVGAILLVSVHGATTPKPGSGTMLETLNSTSIEQLVIQIMEQNLEYDAPRLVIMHELPAAADVITPKICGGKPGIVVKSNTIPSNKGCFKRSVTPSILSCTCIDGYDESSDTWEFKLSIPPPLTAPIPTSVARDKVHGVSSLLLIGVPAYVKTLYVVLSLVFCCCLHHLSMCLRKLLGQGNKFVPIGLKQPPFPGVSTDIAILQTTQSVTVTTL